MDRCQAMKVFVRVAENQGFAKAARQLNMSSPAVTRIVASLEDAIGTRLLSRTTRSVKLTEAGERYVEDCRRILSEIEEAEAAAAGSYSTPTGTLTVTASVQFGRLYVLPIVTEYLSRHLHVVARALFVDRVVNLTEDGVDVAVRIGRLADSGFTAIRVGTVRRIVCAAPAYLDRHGTPRVPHDLQDHQIINSSSIADSAEWRFGGERKSVVRLRPRLTCSTIDAALAAAIDGQGVVMALSYQVAHAVAEGRLRIVLDHRDEEPMPVHVVNPEGRRASARVRGFVDLAVERLRADPMID